MLVRVLHRPVRHETSRIPRTLGICTRKQGFCLGEKGVHSERSAQLIPQNPVRETGKPQRLRLPCLGNEKQFLIKAVTENFRSQPAMHMRDTVQVKGKRQKRVLTTLTRAKREPEFSSVGSSFCEA